MENKSSLFGIIAIIIGASGLGLGAYSMVNFQTVEGPQGLPGEDGTDGLDGIDGINGTVGLLVGLWEELDEDYDNPSHTTTSDYLIEVMVTKVNNTEYIILNQSSQFKNTRFHLIKSGWYRFNLITILSITSGTVWINIARNANYVDITENILTVGRYVGPGIWSINSAFYRYSNGTDFYEINVCFGVSTMYGGQNHNQLSIEYVGDY